MIVNHLSALPGRVSTVAATARAATRGVARADSAVVFAYHDIGDPAVNHTRYLISPQLFRRQLEVAVRAGYLFVELSAVVERLTRRESLRGLAVVTFDDSLVGIARHVAPILADLGIPATVFAVSGALGSLPGWWRGAARVMTAQELGQLDQYGVRVESHTVHHPSLPSLEIDGLDRELGDSKRQLEDLLGREVRHLAYPFGHYDERVMDRAEAAGYDAAVTFLNGRLTSDVGRFRIPRLNMWSGQGRARLLYHLARPEHSWPEHQLAAVGGPLGEHVV